jgi:hypothetical protein
VADFFVLDALRNDIVGTMRDHLEQKMKIMCNAKYIIDTRECKAIVQDFFHAVATTYHELPHTQPCRQLILDYAHAIRLNLYRTTEFVERIADFPELASDLFLIAVRGRQSQWAGDSLADYRNYFMNTKCSGCSCSAKKPVSWNIDPKARGPNIRIMETHWKCENCIKKTGYPWQGRGDAEVQK